MIRHVTSVNGDIITSSMHNNKCIDCIHMNTVNGYSNIICKNDGISKRIAIVSNKNGTLLACSACSKTTKLFKENVQSIANTIKDMINIQKQVVSDVTQAQQARIDRVVHNLKSINAHYIQELYGLIPQERFTKNIWDTMSIVEEAIKADTYETARTFLRLAKLTISTKAEFSVYEKLMKDDPPLSLGIHTIRDVVMIVLYMFFGDFTRKDIYVDVANSFEMARFDFESIQVAFYHIIENGVKYIKPGTKMTINFSKDSNFHYVEFEMESIHVLPHERDLIFNEGYSGINARESKKSGNGIGMYLVKRLLKLNNAVIVSEFGNDVDIEDDIEYSYNKFTVQMPT